MPKPWINAPEALFACLDRRKQIRARFSPKPQLLDLNRPQIVEVGGVRTFSC
jgi:hypothetical protein